MMYHLLYWNIFCFRLILFLHDIGVESLQGMVEWNLVGHHQNGLGLIFKKTTNPGQHIWMFIGENYTPLSHGYFPSGCSLGMGSQTLAEILGGDNPSPNRDGLRRQGHRSLRRSVQSESSTLYLLGSDSWRRGIIQLGKLLDLERKFTGCYLVILLGLYGDDAVSHGILGDHASLVGPSYVLVIY